MSVFFCSKQRGGCGYVGRQEEWKDDGHWTVSTNIFVEIGLLAEPLQVYHQKLTCPNCRAARPVTVTPENVDAVIIDPISRGNACALLGLSPSHVIPVCKDFQTQLTIS